MNLTPKSEELLRSLYKFTNESDAIDFQYNYSTDSEQRIQEQHAIERLVFDGYIAKLGGAIGFAILRITRKGIQYIENGRDDHSIASPSAVTFNFNAPISNSVVGSQTTVSMAVNPSLQEISDLISQAERADQEQLKEVLKQLQQVESGNQPMSKGFLSSALATLNKYPALITSIGQLLFKLATNS